MEQNLKQARENLAWIIKQMEESDAKYKEKYAKDGFVLQGEDGMIFHLKNVLELLG